FGQPGRVLVEAAEMPDGAAFLCMARTLEMPHSAFSERPRRMALLLVCDLTHRDVLVYGSALPAGTTHGDDGPRYLPIGPACRLCERTGCMARAEPPVTRPLGLDEMARGFSAFDFQ